MHKPLSKIREARCIPVFILHDSVVVGGLGEQRKRYRRREGIKTGKEEEVEGGEKNKKIKNQILPSCLSPSRHFFLFPFVLFQMQTAMASQPLSLPTPRSSTPTAPRSAAGSLTQKSSVVPFVRPSSLSANDEFGGAGSATHVSLPSSLRAARAARSLSSNNNSQNGGSSSVRVTPSSSLRRPTWRGSPAAAAVAPPAVRVSGFAAATSSATKTTSTSAHAVHAPASSSGATGLLSRVLHVREGSSLASQVRERSLRERQARGSQTLF